MSQVVDKAEKAAILAGTDLAIKFMRKNPDRDLTKIADPVLKIASATHMFPQDKLDAIKKGISNPNNPYLQMFKSMLTEIDPHIIKTFAGSMGFEAAIKGTKEVRANRIKYNCNIPWLILMDPTSACNLHCTGCWAAEYGHKLNLTLEDMQSVINQGRALGTHVYMFTGGEPLVRKKDIITLCERNQDCIFLSFTNATLIDQAFCDEVRRVGNIAFALSVEGTEESNDARRGDGAYQKTMRAMDLLRENHCLFGMSVCYTKANVDMVTSDEFLDKMVSKGVRYGLYFNYMPVGKDASPDLIPTPAQRKYMYYWMKRVRNGSTGKPMFIFDFQDDGPYVGGCIAGGRNYFHINSKGDMEPCVFIHYSDSNIHYTSILDALRNPLFMAYRKGQPFNDNHLRPCPMLENPEKLREIVKETGAKSTDLMAAEDVDSLCGKCDEFALEWQPVADEIWASNPHPKIHTQYYRDGGQLKVSQ